MTRMLYIMNGPNPPHLDESLDQFSYLSEIVEGEILLPVWGRSLDVLPEVLSSTYPVHRVGRFTYHLYQPERLPIPLRLFAKLSFYLRLGLQLHRKQKFDLIMTYGTNATGIAGVILKWLTGAKLIAKIPGNPRDSFRRGDHAAGIGSSIKRFVADLNLHLVCGAADCIRLLYPWQLQKYRLLCNKKSAVLPPFVPIGRAIVCDATPHASVLSMGYPWHTKGFDILIRAFMSIAKRFPQYRLKIVAAGVDYLKELAKGCAQIEFEGPLPYALALEEMAHCSVYVLASRTEGLPRVLQDAMAAKKPIIASAVGGVPYLIQDGDTGLLFESENVEELAKKLTLMFSSPELRSHLADRGYQKVTTELSEQAHVRSFRAMLEAAGVKTLGPSKPPAHEQQRGFSAGESP